MITEGYPIEITHTAEWLCKLAPLLKISVKLMALTNGVASFASLFLPGVQDISQSLLDKGRSMLDQATQESSVAEYDVLCQAMPENYQYNAKDGLDSLILTNPLQGHNQMYAALR